MTKEKPSCQRTAKWLRDLGEDAAPLTGQDWRALKAFVHLVELYSVSGNPGRRCAVEAMTMTLLAMQPKCWTLAKRCIPMVMDWGDEPKIWSALRLSLDHAILGRSEELGIEAPCSETRRQNGTL